MVDGTSIGVPAAIAAGELAATRVTIDLPKAAEPPASVTLLVDTSASRSLGFAAEARTVHQLVDELAHAYGGALPVQVVAFDQITTPIYDGRADKIGGVEAALVERGALGASDLGQALTWLAGHAPKSRIVVVTDGVFTAGAAGDALPALAKQLSGHGVERIDVALAGGIRDEQTAAAVAHAGLARTGAVLDLDKGVPEVARRIGLAVRTELPVAVDGARWVFPRTIAAAQAGDQVTVFSRQGARAQQLAVTVAGTRTMVSVVWRAWARVRRLGSPSPTRGSRRRRRGGGSWLGDRKRSAAPCVELDLMLVLSPTPTRATARSLRAADIPAIGPSGVGAHHLRAAAGPRSCTGCRRPKRQDRRPRAGKARRPPAGGSGRQVKLQGATARGGNPPPVRRDRHRHRGTRRGPRRAGAAGGAITGFPSGRPGALARAPAGLRPPRATWSQPRGPGRWPAGSSADGSCLRESAFASATTPATRGIVARCPARRAGER